MKMGPMITTALLAGTSLFSSNMAEAQTADSTVLSMRNFVGSEYREKDSVVMLFFDARDSLYMSNRYLLVIAKKDINGNRMPDIGEPDLMATYSTVPNPKEIVLLDLKKEKYAIVSLEPEGLSQEEGNKDDMEIIREHFESRFKRFKKEVGTLDNARKQIKDFYGYKL